MISATNNGQTSTYSYDSDGRRVKRNVNGSEIWQVYGIGGELLAEYAANASASSPQKEYGYRNGQLLITASTFTTTGYVGCFTDDSNRALPALLGTSETVESCKQKAATAGYGYAGLQWYGQCWAGNNLNYTQVAENQCNTPCTANASETCGGAYRNSIYSTVADVRWIVTDQLGTPRMIFDKTGGLAAMTRHDYLPFGEEVYATTGLRTTTQGYTVNDGVRQRFTQKERDNETGLDYFGARYYASTQGRFTSVDPINTVIEERVVDPQQVNLYAYSRNNSLKFIDPTGMKIDVSRLNKNDRKEWNEIERTANAKDELGNYVNPELHEQYQLLQDDERTFFIENHDFGDRSQVTGDFTITKFTADQKDFTEAVIKLDFKKIGNLDKPVAADLVSGFNKFEGLFGKDGAALRLAELFGHEAAHGVFALKNPAEAVRLQMLLNDRDASIAALPKKHRYPLPPNVRQKVDAARSGLDPTERFAQQTEQRINHELNPALRGSKCKKI